MEIIVNTAVDGYDGESVSLACAYSGRTHARAASTLVLVTSREPCDELYANLTGPEGESTELHIQRIGDCRQPALIAHAVYAGHQAARELGQAPEPLPQRDRTVM